MTVGVITIAAYPESKAGLPGVLAAVLVPGTAAELPEFKYSVWGVPIGLLLCMTCTMQLYSFLPMLFSLLVKFSWQFKEMFFHPRLQFIEIQLTSSIV